MILLDNDWEFTPAWTDAFAEGSGTGEPVRLPHTVKEVPLHEADPASYQMICGYRRMLKIPDDAEGKRLFLQFDGCAHIAEVFVNGKKCAEHRCGYTAFRTEITDLVSLNEENRIAVKLDTTENPSIPPFGFVMDYLAYGGIYRDVWLDVRNQTYLNDVYLRTPRTDQIIAKTQLDGDADGMELQLCVKDEEGNEVLSETWPASEHSHACRIINPHLWSMEDPYLYQAEVSLKKGKEILDTVSRHLGIRTVSIDQDHILLNGKQVFLRGLNRHQCYPYVGYAASQSLQREDARILKAELQVNAVRTSHYPQSQYFLDACDEIGLAVFTEIPGWQHISYDPGWREQCVQNVREMVMQYRNHPSIFLWGVRINESLDDDELYQKTNAAAHELDPDRPTSGVRYLEKSHLLEDVYAFNDFSHNGTNGGARPKDKVTPDGNKPMLISEANGHMFPTKPYDTWQRRQEHALRHARVLNDAMADGKHAGCFQWCMFDYPTHQDFGSGDRICYHGVMDSFRNPKPAASLYASQGESEPILEVCTPMDIGDYNAGQIGEIYAFTNADEVRLYKNDQFVKSFHSEGWSGLKHGPVKIDDLIGELIRENEHFPEAEAKLIHDCLLAAKEKGMSNLPLSIKLKLLYAMKHYHLTMADGYRLFGTYVGNWGGKATVWRFDAVKGGKVVKSVVKTPDTKLHLEVKNSNPCMHEGSTYDMSAIRIRLLDSNDNLASYAQIPVCFRAEGPIEIAGPKIAVLEGGMGGTYVRTVGKTGNAVLHIQTDQTESVSVSFIID